MKKKTNDITLIRAALYVRVSAEEQKIKGLSLEAQQERLETYAKEHGWIIQGIYIDAAKTARKNLNKRTEFQKMLEAVKNDEVDILLFCRLDRWFRSVSDYYKIMEILEKHNCEWKTTDEEYDSSTANGRLYINVKLSIAQNEADICGERIDVVFDSKIAHGTVISGSCPFGFQINKEKRLEIIPEAALIVQDAFNYFESGVSQLSTVKYIREKYGINWCIGTFRRMLHEKLYTGIYERGGRYNSNFCPPIISKEQFDRVQILLKKNARHAPSGRIYIFTSILKCAECQHNMVGRMSYKKQPIYYYRCNQHFHRGQCNHKKEIREDYIETWLFNNLETEFKKAKMNWEITSAKHERQYSTFSRDKTGLKRKLTKLKELYVNDLIDIETYKKDYQIYTAALKQLPEPVIETPPNFSALEQLLKKDFKNIYNTLSREEKRTLWRTVINEIQVDSENNITSISFG